MAEFQPPPTWAPVTNTTKDPATGKETSSFNPTWLKWFVDISAFMSAAGVTDDSIPPGTIPPDATRFVISTSVSHEGDTVEFQGTTGRIIRSGGKKVQFADMEIPGDPVDGTNVLFHLLHEPNPSQSLQLFHKLGNRVFIGFGEDYTLAAAGVITMTAPPAVGDYLIAYYRYY